MRATRCPRRGPARVRTSSPRPSARGLCWTEAPKIAHLRYGRRGCGRPRWIRELIECPVLHVVHGSRSRAPARFLPGGEPAPGGRPRRRAADGRRGRAAGGPVGAGTARPARLDRVAHITAVAADTRGHPAVGGGDARDGATVAWLPLPRLDDLPGPCAFAGGVRRVGTRSE